MNTLGSDTNAVLVAMARNLAQRHNLIDRDGIVWCWNCKQQKALLPSLHCARCLTEAWQRLGIIEPQCEQFEQETK